MGTKEHRVRRQIPQEMKRMGRKKSREKPTTRGKKTDEDGKRKRIAGREKSEENGKNMRKPGSRRRKKIHNN